ncbi:sensor histidine kinase [Streptococcus merionis]|uniref:histidine kinase n=1 Tax=Streptococcus merionis TaxID=400065 RepID=A0A239T0J2_9STRE|nr:sensor histidine kinase [Streptococcus merionis]SNU90628.1 Autolysis histidine kinase LytS [Streptococcus merionis]
MDLFLLMLERGGLIIILAYLLVHIPYIKQMVNRPRMVRSQLTLLLLFSLFAVVANYTGVEVTESFDLLNQTTSQIQTTSSLANTRVLAIGVAGLVGGPFVGLGVGLISAIVRYLQGGLAPQIYALSSVLIGLTSGLAGRYFGKRQRQVGIVTVLLLGVGMEMLQMLCILLLSADRVQSLNLVRLIALPMMVTNSLGMAIFISIINATRQLEEQAKAVQTYEVLELANQTLPYLRQGLSVASCQPVAKIIQQYMQVAAVSLTDRQRILAFVGQGEDHHLLEGAILTTLAKQAIDSGQVLLAHRREEIDCHVSACPLSSAIVIPLKVKEETVGTLKLYFSERRSMTHVEQQLAQGLGNVFSTQLALGQAETATRLLQDSEIKSLQAQVNPHFLFNALNTISALIRMDSEKARVLVQDFGKFLRANLQGTRQNLIPLAEELEQVNAYLALENARFPEKVSYHLIRSERVDVKQTIPPFALQVLVENAYKHAFRNRKSGNVLEVVLDQTDAGLTIEVRDNGVGISPERLAQLGQGKLRSVEGTGSAIDNLTRRLGLLYGQGASLRFVSDEKGTVATIKIPLQQVRHKETSEEVV